MSVGQNIKRRRRELDMTLESIAKEVGLSRQTLSRYETGVIGNIPSDKIEALAKVLRTTPSYLMGWEEATTPPAPNLLPAPSFVKKPRLGRVACGQPILAEEHIEDYDLVPDDIKCDFTLVCKGDSMINARIHDGDIVYIRLQERVENGEIAAVYVDGETTLKRVYLSPGQLVLQAENPQYAPMVYTGPELENIRIIGKAVGFTSVIFQIPPSPPV